MALQLILGSSGQGKTEYMMEEVIKESLAHPDRKYYVIVPEQFGLEMQRQMVEKHQRHGFSNIDILSFYRLAYRVFDECEYHPHEILEDLGVSMILKKVLLEHENDLFYFRRSMRYPGFLDELKSILMEFMNYGVTFLDLQAVCGSLSTHPALKEKCQELSMIFQWFSESIQDHFMVSGQILDLLKDMVQDSLMLKEGYFYMDGFTGFTPIQLNFLRELLPYARELVITMTIPYIPSGSRRKSKEDLFSFSEKSIYALLDLCHESHTEIKDPVLLHKDCAVRFGKHYGLSHLEKNLFRTKSEKFDGNVEEIHMTSCYNPEEEAEFVLRKVEELVRRKGYRYRDMAILMGNEEDYPSAFVRRSRSLGIPLYVDTKQKMSYHSGVETIRSLFHLVEMDYSYESVFRYLKSGMSDFNGEDVDELERYIYSSGIRGLSMWKKPFTRRLNKYTEEKILHLQELREKLLAETLDFTMTMKNQDCSVKQKMTVLYESLLKLHFPEKLQEKSRQAEKDADYVKSGNYGKFFKEFLVLMDKIVTIFGEESMELKDLSALIDAGLESLALSSTPLSMDQLILGDLKRTRLADIKVLFFVGVNDGDIPPVPTDQGILCDDEKKILGENGIELSLDLTQRVLEDEYYIYLALSKPRDELYLSCSKLSGDGKAKRPSALFQSLENLFPSLKMIRYPEDTKRLHFKEEDSLEDLILQLRKWSEGQTITDPAFYALLAYWKKRHPEELLRIYERMNRGTNWMPLEEEIAEKLYGKELIGTVTKMENFAACPYQYYCNYGLQLSEWEEFQVNYLDIGNLFHGALQYFSDRIKKEGYSFKAIPKELEEQLLLESVDAVMDENVRDLMNSTARNQYKKNMVERILKRTVEVLRFHLRNSSFEPDRFEFHFGPKDFLETTKISLSNGHKIALRGVIDRVDIFEEEDRLLVKIIDYKSGSKKFDFNQLYYGLQLQLIVYMNAALELYQKEKQKKTEPAAMFYYQIQDPIQAWKDITGDKKMDVYRMSGYVNSSSDIIEQLEHDSSKKESFQLTLNKDGSPRKNSSVMETKDFYMVGEYANTIMKKMGEKIYAGEINAKPYKSGDRTACSYCPYISICAFEENRPDHVYRELEKHSAEEILNQIREEGE